MGALPTPKGTKKPKVSSKSPAKSSAKTKTKGSPPTPKVAAKPVKSDPEVDELKQLFATEGTGNVEETPSVATVMPGIPEVPEVAEPPAEPVVAVKADVAMAPAVEQPMEPTAAPAVAEPQAPVMALDADVAMAPAVEQSMEPAAAPAAAEPQAPDDSKDSFGCRLPLEPFVAAATAEELESQRALALCMALNRCMGPAHQRVKKYNFAIEGCEGFDMQIVTVGVIGDDFGDGTASACSVAYFAALSCSIVTAGPQDDLSTVLACNIVCAHLDGEDAFFAAERLSQLKEGAMLIVANAKSLDIPAVVAALDAGKLGYLGVGALDDSAVPEFTPLCARPNVLVAPLVAKGAVSSAAIPSGMSAAGATETLVAGSEAPDAVRVACFSSRSYFSTRFAEAVSSASPKEIRFEMHSARLDQTSAQLAAGCKAVCLFVNDTASADVLSTLHELGIEVILMRCAGFDKVDVAAAGALGIKVARVPAYSPDAVAQHAVSLLLTLKWKLAAPAAGPLGLNFKATTIGVLGTGRIGCLFALAMQSMGCRVLAYDPFKNKAIEEAGIPYLELDEIYPQADVLSLHVPLLPQTTKMVDAPTIAKFKPGATLLNVSRGALVDTEAVADALESGQLGAYGADVYENEAAYFFDDHSAEEMADSLLARLIGHPNCLLTGHLAFFTREALGQIVGTTMKNLAQYFEGVELQNEVKPPPPKEQAVLPAEEKKEEPASAA